MRTFVATFVAALVVAGVLTPLVRYLALRVGAVALPGGRHVHRAPTPRLGGVAICAAVMVPLVGLFFIETSVATIVMKDQAKALGLFGGIVMCVLGVVDDARGVRAWYKLAFQVLVAIFAFWCGFRIDAISLPLVGTHSMGVFALPITVFWIVGIINAVNLIDGLDGLAAGVVFFAGMTNFVVASINGSVFVAFLSAAILGAVVGFLFYNFNPAKIFMGDSGSYFLGYVLAVSSLTGTSQKTSTAVSLLVPVVALGVPIFDTFLAMARRILERRPIFSADRGHIHHRLLDMGLTHRRAVLIIYSVCVLFAVAAVGISLGTTWQVGLALLSASVILVGFVRFLGYFQLVHFARRQKARIRPRDYHLIRTVVAKLPDALSAARTEEDLFDCLKNAFTEAELGAVELSGLAPPGLAALQWTNADPAKMENAIVSSTFPLGAEHLARATIKFEWQSESGDVSPQSEVLLEVVADMLTVHLVRIRSGLAPLPEVDRREADLEGAHLAPRHSSA